MHACVCGSLLSSVLSPTTSNVVKEPFKLSELHSEAPGSSNACARIFGERAGARLDAWMCKSFNWLLGACAGNMIIQAALPSMLTMLVHTICFLVGSVLGVLCLDVGVVKNLLKVAGVWYFIFASVAGRLSAALVFGQVRFESIRV